jgi:hypothetical protein
VEHGLRLYRSDIGGIEIGSTQSQIDWRAIGPCTQHCPGEGFAKPLGKAHLCRRRCSCWFRNQAVAAVKFSERLVEHAARHPHIGASSVIQEHKANPQVWVILRQPVAQAQGIQACIGRLDRSNAMTTKHFVERSAKPPLRKARIEKSF